jgi:hypothetical protein
VRLYFKNKQGVWSTLVVPVTWEVEVEGLPVQGQLSKIVRPYLKNKLKQKRTGAWLMGGGLVYKCKALSSNPVPL